MTKTFEEMCAERDPLYAAMRPVGEFRLALMNDHTCQYDWYWTEGQRDLLRMERDMRLFPLIVRALQRRGRQWSSSAFCGRHSDHAPRLSIGRRSSCTCALS